MDSPIRVLVVDDARFMRHSLNRLLNAPDIEVVGEAVNGREGVVKFQELRPDVVCLDIDMPQMNGITALKHVMSIRPTPVVIISSLTDRDHVPFEALRLGALEFFPKPSSLAGDLSEQTEHLLYLIRSARQVRTQRLRRVPVFPQPIPSRPEEGNGGSCGHLIGIGGTLGSTGSLLRLLSLLRSRAGSDVAILCKVPLHPAIRVSFLESVKDLLGWEVSECEGREPVRSGWVYVVPPEASVRFEGEEVVFDSAGSTGSNGSGPSLDGMFRAVSTKFGANATVILLAGDVTEGADGVREASLNGARCFLQDQHSALFATWTPQVPDSIRHVELEGMVDEFDAGIGSRDHEPAVGA